MMKNKKAMTFGIIATLVIVFIALIVLLSIQGGFLKGTMDSFKKMMGINIDESKLKQIEENKADDQNVIASMQALIKGINYAAKGETLYANNKLLLEKVSSLNFKKYRISYSAQARMLDSKGSENDFDWIFSKEFAVDENTAESTQIDVPADYNLGVCKSKGKAKDGFGQGECLKADDLSNSKYDGVEISLAKMIQLNPVYNIKLETLDENNKVLCSISTFAENSFDDFFKPKSNKLSQKIFGSTDLMTWGNLQKGVCKSLKDCDRNGDGIPGSFPKEAYGMPAQEVLDNAFGAGHWKKLVDSGVAKQYFGGAIISSKSDQGCFDSPTWLECPGIKIYYCAKDGKLSGASSDNNYFLQKKDEIHSRTGIRVWTILDEKIAADNVGKASVRRDNGDYKLLGQKGAEIKDMSKTDYSFFWSAFSYTSPIAKPIEKNLRGQFDADLTKNDPLISCYGGENISNVLIKCDGRSCNVCNFYLPQKIESNSFNPADWIAGNGDPKYVIYYEAFPRGEEEAWQIDKESASLVSIAFTSAVWNIALPGIGKTAKFLKASKVVKNIKPTEAIGTTAQEVADKTVQKNLGTKIAEYSLYRKWKSLKGLSDEARVDKLKEFLEAGMEKQGGTLTGKITKEGAEYYKSVLKSSKLNDFSNYELGLQYVEGIKPHKAMLDSIEKELGENFLAPLRAAAEKSASKEVAQNLVAYAFALQLAKMDSMNEKFDSIGINTIGMKQPLNKVFFSGDGVSEIPLIDPEVSKYYIALEKDYYDSETSGKSKTKQRFFLASPCRANLRIVKEKCICTYPDSLNDIYEYHDFGSGQIPVSKESLGAENSGRDYNSAVKYCFSSADVIDYENSINVGGAKQSECIIITPTMDKNGNFCYATDHTYLKVAKYSVFAVNIAAQIGVNAVVTSATGGAGIVAAPAINTLMDVGAAMLESWVAAKAKWPNH